MIQRQVKELSRHRSETCETIVTDFAPPRRLCLLSRSRKQTKQLQHLRALESLISVFPTANSSGAESTKGSDLVSGPREKGELEEEEEELDEEQARGMDMSALLERIRARYKLACSILGVAPRETSSGTSNSDDLNADDLNNHKARIGGKLVDPNQLRY